MKKHEIISLKAGIAIPFIYFGSVLLAAVFYPGFSFTRQFASELGADGSPHPNILNVGLMLVGVASLIASFGFWRALRHLGAKPVPARLTCYLIAMFGVAILMAGIFPIPSILLHSGFGLSMPIMIGPVVLATALKQRDDARPLRNYLLLTNILMAAFLVFYLAATRTKCAGLGQLLYSLTAIPWMGISAYLLSTYVSKEHNERHRMKNRNRMYATALAVLALLATLSSGLLLFLAGASTGGAIDTPLPEWSLPWVALINFAYAFAIIVTLCARRFSPATGRAISRVLNWTLLPALPGGTIVGLYGLFRADREDQ